MIRAIRQDDLFFDTGSSVRTYVHTQGEGVAIVRPFGCSVADG